jgi:hypothetical protein
MELMTTKTENRGRWQPGQSGNAAGKPAGARSRFSRAFLEDLAEVWSELGRGAMVSTARTNPSTFFAIASKLIPANVELTIKETYGGLGPEDFAILQAIKQALPDAGQRSPSEVLSYTLDALRAHGARAIEATHTLGE